MFEEITLVDIDDHITGYSTKDVHKRGLLHRAFSVFIVNDNIMLIQMRNPNKYHSGGLWSNACCSHQRKEEILSEAVHRRMNEELDHVFVGEYCGEVCIDPNEASEIRWVEFDKLKSELLDNPENFSSWFIICAPRVLNLLGEIK